MLSGKTRLQAFSLDTKVTSSEKPDSEPHVHLYILTLLKVWLILFLENDT